MNRAEIKNQLAGLILPETEFYFCSLMDCSAYFWYDNFRNELKDWSKNGINPTGVNIDPTFVFENSYPFIELDGVDDRFEVSNFSFLDLGLDDFTIFMWIKADSLTSSQYPEPCSKGQTYSKGGWEFWITNISGSVNYGKINFRINTSDGLNPKIVSSNTVIFDNWFFVTVRRNGATLELLLNNVLESTRNDANINATDTSFPFKIGVRGDNLYTYKGLISELAFIRKYLSDSELKFIYENSITTRLI